MCQFFGPVGFYAAAQLPVGSQGFLLIGKPGAGGSAENIMTAFKNRYAYNSGCPPQQNGLFGKGFFVYSGIFQMFRNLFFGGHKGNFFIGKAVGWCAQKIVCSE